MNKRTPCVTKCVVSYRLCWIWVPARGPELSGRNGACFGLPRLGACPGIRRGRAHGACEARSRREEEGDVGAHRRRRATKRSPATPMRPLGSGRRGGICGVGAPRRCAVTSPASRRLASAPSAPGTRTLIILGQAPRFRGGSSGAHDKLVSRDFRPEGPARSSPGRKGAGEDARRDPLPYGRGSVRP